MTRRDGFACPGRTRTSPLAQKLTSDFSAYSVSSSSPFVRLVPFASLPSDAFLPGLRTKLSRQVEGHWDPEENSGTVSVLLHLLLSSHCGVLLRIFAGVARVGKALRRCRVSDHRRIRRLESHDLPLTLIPRVAVSVLC
jgi:hypothetical protein